MSLEGPIAYFKEHQEEFAKDHHGQFVVIYENSVEGFYDNEMEAYLAAKAKFPPGSFLLRPCIRPEEETAAVFRSRVAS